MRFREFRKFIESEEVEFLAMIIALVFFMLHMAESDLCARREIPPMLSGAVDSADLWIPRPTAVDNFLKAREGPAKQKAMIAWMVNMPRRLHDKAIGLSRTFRASEENFIFSPAAKFLLWSWMWPPDSKFIHSRL